MPEPRTITINGQRWRFAWENPGPRKQGECDSPRGRGKTIRIRPSLRRRSQALLEALLHELLHAADWTKDEEWVDHVAADLARNLKLFGYGRLPDLPATRALPQRGLRRPLPAGGVAAP